MSTLIVLVAILAAVMVWAYSNAQHGEVKSVVRRIPCVKLETGYLLEAQILSELALEKDIQNQQHSKRRVTLHLVLGLPTLLPLLPQLTQLTSSYDFYLVLPKHSVQLPSLPSSIKLFTYNTVAGCQAIIRQLSANLHIETSADMLRVLAPFLGSIVTTREVMDRQGEEVLARAGRLQGLGSLGEILDGMKSR